MLTSSTEYYKNGGQVAKEHHPLPVFGEEVEQKFHVANFFGEKNDDRVSVKLGQFAREDV
jgi:hypothetical protein